MSESERHIFKSFDALPSALKGEAGKFTPSQHQPADKQRHTSHSQREGRFRGYPDRVILDRKESLRLLELKQRELESIVREDTSKIRRLKSEIERFESERNDQLAKQEDELRAAREKAEAALPEARLQQLTIREAKIEADLVAARKLEELAAAKLQQANKAFERAEEERKAVEAPLDDFKLRVRKLQSDLRESRKIAQEFSDQTAALLRSNSRYKARAKKAEANAEDLRSEVSRLSRQLGNRTPRNEKLADKIADEAGRLFAHCPETRLWLLSLEHYEDADIGWSNAIVTLGRDPLDEEFFDALLDDKQFTPFEAGCRDASIMIVGRESCSMSDVYKQIAARRGDGLRVYSQEMAVIALATGCDPFEASEEALEEMGKSHPVLRELMEDKFEWPALHRRRSAAAAVIEIAKWNPLSPLTAMGYHTGREFTNARERRERLADIVEGRLVFPDGFSAHRRNEWGFPGSRQRIKKVALQLVQNISLPGQSPFLGLAAEHWESDYEWLKRQYPKGGAGGWPRL
jgi:hypothetical protein